MISDYPLTIKRTAIILQQFFHLPTRCSSSWLKKLLNVVEVDWARCSQSGWESLNYFSTMADLSWFSWSLSLYSIWEVEKVILVIRFPGVWCKWYKANLKWADYCFWKAITGMQQWFKGQTKPRKSSFLFSSSKMWVRFASQHQCIITPHENLQFLNWRLQPSLQWIMTSRKKV